MLIIKFSLCYLIEIQISCAEHVLMETSRFNLSKEVGSCLANVMNFGAGIYDQDSPRISLAAGCQWNRLIRD